MVPYERLWIANDGKTVLLILFPYVNNLYLNLETMQACRQNYLEDNQAPSKIANISTADRKLA